MTIYKPRREAWSRSLPRELQKKSHLLGWHLDLGCEVSRAWGNKFLSQLVYGTLLCPPWKNQYASKPKISRIKKKIIWFQIALEKAFERIRCLFKIKNFQQSRNTKRCYLKKGIHRKLKRETSILSSKI